MDTHGSELRVCPSLRATRGAETAGYAAAHDAFDGHLQVRRSPVPSLGHRGGDAAQRRKQDEPHIASRNAGSFAPLKPLEALADNGPMVLGEALAPSYVTVWVLGRVAIVCAVGTNGLLDVASASTSARGNFVEASRLTNSYHTSVFVSRHASARAPRIATRSRPPRSIFKRSSPSWSSE